MNRFQPTVKIIVGQKPLDWLAEPWFMAGLNLLGIKKRFRAMIRYLGL